MNEDTTFLSAAQARRETSGGSGLTRARDVVATQIRNAAEMLDEHANQDGMRNERFAQFERSAARTIQGWSERLSDWDVDRMDQRVRSYVQERPTAALLTAAAVGLCIGLWMRKR